MKYNKVVLVFPGQGSQYEGMGKELYDKSRLVSHIYASASDELGYDVSKICFSKHRIKKIFMKVPLDKTLFTQPAILTTSYANFKALEDRCKEIGIKLNPFLVMGHSLGEYTALIASGAMDFETALTLVKKRATYMSEAGKRYKDAGLMSVISRGREIKPKDIEALCKQYEVYIALNNTQHQIVVGGPGKSLDSLSEKLKKEGVITKRFPVEGPFHTPFTEGAAEKFQKELEKAKIYIASKPIIANVTAKAIADPIDIRQELYWQICSTVDWLGSVRNAIASGADLFIEIGPKTVLSNMIKEIDPKKPTLHVEDVKSLEETVRELKV